MRRAAALLNSLTPPDVLLCSSQMLIEAVKTGGRIGVDGVYVPSDPTGQSVTYALCHGFVGVSCR